tara:strand:- start:135 stop:677 length:543 start_codon:yes stop_codon:yes gene_type:complete
MDLDLYNFSPNNFLNWITAFCIFEIPLAFFYLSISKKTDTVTNWYTGNTINIWNVVAQDLLYGLCGVIIALSIFNYLCKKKIISKKYLYFVLVLIGVQLVGDLTFATIIRSWPQKYSTKWINYFKTYIKKSKFNALIGDSLWILSWALTFYFVKRYIKNFNTKIFIISFFFFLLSAYSEK